MTAPTASAEERVAEWLVECRSWADAEIVRTIGGLQGAPETLTDAMSHACLAGGKRLRPALVRLFCEALGGDQGAAARPAVAIEMVHTYSLVHDDLPCMDDDDIRRGQPTVHCKWDEATAVLAGDALLTEAFGVLAPHPAAAGLVEVLAAAAGAVGMVGGQILDLGVELGPLSEPERERAVVAVHAAKTAALFGAACEMGCVAAGGTSAAREASRDYGRELGMLFQATDDVIDVTGTASSLGKTPGKDAALERPTLVAAVGLEGAQARAEEHAAAALEAVKGLGLEEGHHALSLVGVLAARKG